MALARNLADLPTPAKTSDGGRAPDSEPRFVQALVEGWREMDGGPKPRAVEGSRFRHSDAGKCARAIAYAALEVPDSNPMDLSGWWNTGLGTVIHEAWQHQLRRRYPDAEIEPKVKLGQGSGHIDAVVTLPEGGPWVSMPETDAGEHSGFLDKKVCIELKSIGGFAYKLAIGERGAPQGPKHEHIVQAALNALAVDADEAVIAYLSKEAVSVAIAQRKNLSELTRFCAEWTFPREEYLPIAEAELRRVDGILALLDQGELPARKFPGDELPAGHVITDPKSGQWQVLGDDGMILNAGSWWACGYCRWQDRCIGTAAGRQPIAEVEVTLGLRTEAA